MPTQLLPFWPHFVTTLEQRPYVFVFLISFLILGSLQLGLKRTLLFLGLGWGIAFASEVSSIRNGFPYGDYQYVYENLKGELLLWGVPLWDSLSYTFLAYASYATSVVVLSFPPFDKGRSGGILESKIPLNPPLQKGEDSISNKFFLQTRSSWKVLLLSVVLMTGIDVVIDPLTALGDQWFLGRIYYYPNGGFYFGVPFSNFLGWALVAFCIVFLFQRCDQRLEKKGDVVKPWQGLQAYWGSFLYLGVFFFNWSITLYLKLWGLSFADLLLVSPLLIALIKSRKRFYS